MNIKNLLLILLTAITVIYYFPIINLPVDAIDESFILVGADRIVKGEIPHKDFSSEYPAGQYYMLAAFFKLFGTSVTAERAYDILTKSLLSIIIFLIIRLLSSTKLALAGWVMSLVWIMHNSAPAYSGYPCLLSIYIGIYLLLLYMKYQKDHYVVSSAVFIGISVLFRHDLGVFTVIVIIAILLVRRMMKVESWRPLVLFITGGLMIGLPVIVFIVINADVRAAINDLVIIPLTYLQHQTLPYPNLSRWSLPFYIFPPAILIGAIASIILIRRNRDDRDAYAILLISFIGIFFFDRIRMRPDTKHLLSVALTGILIAPVLLNKLLKELSLSTLQKKVVYLLFIIVFGITLSRPVEVIHRILSRTSGYIIHDLNPDIERARYNHVSEDIKSAVSYIKANSSNDDYIYVGVKNHDKFVFNDLLIYFLAERNYASRFHALNPGVQTTASIQKEMINEFKGNSPRIIVLGYRTWNEPNLSAIDTKVDLLDNYIATNFEFKKAYGPYEIWMSKL